jgi:hypothetical protein
MALQAGKNAMAMHLTARDFCEALAAQLVQGKRAELPLDDADMAAATYCIAQDFLRAARRALEDGNLSLSDDLLAILDEIGPNPNTGAFDYFWSNLRQLQPARAGVDNPLYPDLKIKPAAAIGATLSSDLDPVWRELIHSSATHITRRL